MSAAGRHRREVRRLRVVGVAAAAVAVAGLAAGSIAHAEENRTPAVVAPVTVADVRMGYALNHHGEQHWPRAVKLEWLDR